MKISCLRCNILFSPDCFRTEQLPSVLENEISKEKPRDNVETRRNRADQFERPNHEIYSRLLKADVCLDHINIPTEPSLYNIAKQLNEKRDT